MECLLVLHGHKLSLSEVGQSVSPRVPVPPSSRPRPSNTFTRSWRWCPRSSRPIRRYGGPSRGKAPTPAHTSRQPPTSPVRRPASSEQLLATPPPPPTAQHSLTG